MHLQAEALLLVKRLTPEAMTARLHASLHATAMSARSKLAAKTHAVVLTEALLVRAAATELSLAPALLARLQLAVVLTSDVQLAALLPRDVRPAAEHRAPP